MSGIEFYKFVAFFFIYGVLGWCLEVAYAAVKKQYFINRGFLNGPICPIYGFGVVAVVLLLMPYKSHLIVLYIASTIVVSVLEGLTGFFMDKIFHHRWWDYTGRFMNIGGYVCLQFSMIWGVLCVFIVELFHPLVQHFVRWFPVIPGRIILAALCVVAIADCYITATAIFKLNKKLESMEKIAEELRVISDSLGEEIFENVLEMERKGKNLEKRRDVRIAFALQEKQELEKEIEENKEELRMQLVKRREELNQRYTEYLERRSKVGMRLLEAFPDMKPHKHNVHFDRLKKEVRESRLRRGQNTD